MSDYFADSCYYCKAHFCDKNGSHREDFIATKVVGHSAGEMEAKKILLQMHPEASESSIRLLPCSREEYEKRRLN